MKTYGRLRKKYGAIIEDVFLPPFIVPIGYSGWHFIGELKTKIPIDIFNKFSMLYIPEDFCTVHDDNKCYCYEI